MAPDEAVDDHGFAVTGGAVEQQVGHPRLVRVGEQVVEFGQDVLSASVADPTGAADPFNPLVIGEQQGRLGGLAQMIDLSHRAPPGRQTVQYRPRRPVRVARMRCQHEG